MSSLLVIVTLVVTASAAARGTWSPCGLSMVSAINPLAERGRGYRYWLTVLWFVLGAAAGGALLGAGAAVMAWLAEPLPAAVAALVGSLGCLVAMASDWRLGGFRLPIHPRQVNERWLMHYRRWLYASGFGFQIGTGFATYIMTAATYLLVLLAALTGSPGWAMTTGLTFGLVRGAALLLSSRCRSPESLRALHLALERFEPASRHAVIAVEAVGATVLGAAALATTAGAGSLPAVTGALVAMTVVVTAALIVGWARRPGRRNFRSGKAGPGVRRTTRRIRQLTGDAG
jgi:hypothetical protein